MCVFVYVCVWGVGVVVAVVGVGFVRLGEAVKNSIEQRMLRFNEWEHFDWLWSLVFVPRQGQRRGGLKAYQSQSQRQRGKGRPGIQNISLRFDSIYCDWFADLTMLNIGDVANFLIGTKHTPTPTTSGGGRGAWSCGLLKKKKKTSWLARLGWRCLRASKLPAEQLRDWQYDFQKLF